MRKMGKRMKKMNIRKEKMGVERWMRFRHSRKRAFWLKGSR